MIIELGDNGLRSRYHWTTYDIDDQLIDSYCDEARIRFASNDPHTRAQITAYLAVRSICAFLTRDNHEWEAKDYGPAQSIHHERLRALQETSRYSITIRKKLSTREARYWFHFGYRVPGQPY